jgi:hypothetical protein
VTFRQNDPYMRRLLSFFALCAIVPATAALAQPVVGPQVRVDVGAGTSSCNETTASSSDINPLEIVMGWNDYRTPGAVRSGFALSMNGGASWTDFLIRPPRRTRAPSRAIR